MKANMVSYENPSMLNHYTSNCYGNRMVSEEEEVMIKNYDIMHLGGPQTPNPEHITHRNKFDKFYYPDTMSRNLFAVQKQNAFDPEQDALDQIVRRETNVINDKIYSDVIDRHNNHYDILSRQRAEQNENMLFLPNGKPRMRQVNEGVISSRDPMINGIEAFRTSNDEYTRNKLRMGNHA